MSIASWKCAKIRLSSSANAQNQVGVDPALPAMPEAVNQPQVMEGPAGVLRCPAPGTLVQRPADQIQSGARPLGNNVQNPTQRLAPPLHPGEASNRRSQPQTPVLLVAT